MPTRVAITIAGAVSLGSYEAGVVYELLEAFRTHNREAGPEAKIYVDVITGASAGGMGSLAMMRTSSSHIAPAGGGAESFDQNKKVGFETRPAGNAVSLEDEMLKVSANQMDYAAVTSLYSKSLHLLKTAIGKA